MSDAYDPSLYSGIRLTVNQKTKLDLIKDSIPKPDGYIPPRSLPTWKEMALEQKLPLLPAPEGTLYFSRGPLSKSLARANKRYTTDDPLNRERVPSDKYEILHDPATRVDQNKHATEFLKTEGHVNENGEVICSIQEFNRYRKYLATLYNDKVRKKVQEMDDLMDFERETTKALIQQELHEKGQGKLAICLERIAAGKQLLKERQELQRRRLSIKTKVKAERLLALEQERIRMQTIKTMERSEKKKLQEQKQADKLAAEKAKQKAQMYSMTLRDLKTKAQINHIKKEKKILHEKKLSDWFDAKMVSAAERLQREHEIQAIYEHDLKHRAVKRQKHMERLREELPLRIAKKKADEQRLQEIVRKYALRWLTKVRLIMSRADDPMHASLWYNDRKNCLKEGVAYLYQQSGYEKLDDFVMSILKFKQALKQQLLEDEEEDEDDEDFDE